MRTFPPQLAAVALLLASCADTNRYQSHWTLYPRTPNEARSIVLETTRKAGYQVSPAGDFDLEGSYAGEAYTISVRIGIRPAGNECEIQVTTTGVVSGPETARLRNAYERILGQLDTALRR